MEAFEKLVKWLEGDTEKRIPKALIASSLEIVDDPVTGRSVFAVSQIKSHQKLITIPHTYLLNYITIFKHLEAWNPTLKVAGLNYGQIHVPRYTKVDEDDFEISAIYRSLKMEEVLRLSSFQLVSLYLTLEKKRGELSFWKPFIDVQPDYEDLKFMPFTWLVKNIHTSIFPLLPQTIQDHCNKQLEKFNTDYKVVSELISGHYKGQVGEILSKDEFLRAWLCCNSRCLYMELPKKLNKTVEDNFTLVPFVDFLNHHCDDHCGIEIANHQGFIVNSQGSTYQKGDQIYFNYGAHNDEFLLCEYGFMFDLGVNKYNSLDLTSYIEKLMQPQQSAFLKKEGYYGEYTCSKTELSFRTEIALSAIQENPAYFADDGCPRSLRLFIDGFTDGECYKFNNAELSQKIIRMIRKESKTKIKELKEMKGDKDIVEMVIKTHEKLIDIAKHYID